MAKMVMKIMGGLLLVIIVAFCVRLVIMAQKSPSIVNKNVGLENGHLKACGFKTNWFPTQAEKGLEFYNEPFVHENIGGCWDDFNGTLKENGI